MPDTSTNNIVNAIADTTGAWMRVLNNGPMSFGARVAGTGAVAATVAVEASMDGTNVFVTLGTITLSGTTNAADGFGTLIAWPFVRLRASGISGTGATVNGYIGA